MAVESELGTYPGIKFDDLVCLDIGLAPGSGNCVPGSFDPSSILRFGVSKSESRAMRVFVDLLLVAIGSWNLGGDCHIVRK